jgi:hypothetical protein
MLAETRQTPVLDNRQRKAEHGDPDQMHLSRSIARNASTESLRPMRDGSRRCRTLKAGFDLVPDWRLDPDFVVFGESILSR